MRKKKKHEKKNIRNIKKEISSLPGFMFAGRPHLG